MINVISHTSGSTLLTETKLATVQGGVTAAQIRDLVSRRPDSVVLQRRPPMECGYSEGRRRIPFPPV